MIPALIIGGAMITMMLISRRLNGQRREALIEAGATKLATCSASLTQTLAWTYFPSATVYVVNGVLVLMTSSPVRLFREGLKTEPIPKWPRGRFAIYATEVSVEYDTVTIRFTGFISGKLKLKGLPSDDQERILKALAN